MNSWKDIILIRLRCNLLLSSVCCVPSMLVYLLWFEAHGVDGRVWLLLCLNMISLFGQSLKCEQSWAPFRELLAQK